MVVDSDRVLKTLVFHDVVLNDACRSKANISTLFCNFSILFQKQLSTACAEYEKNGNKP